MKINVYIVGVKSNNSQCCQFTILKYFSDADSKVKSISPKDAQFSIYWCPIFRFNNRILNMWVLGSSKGDEIGKNQCQFWLINANVSFRLDIMSETGEEVQIPLTPHCTGAATDRCARKGWKGVVSKANVRKYS